MKLLAVVTTYYPDLTLLQENINQFIDYSDEVLIVENTPLFEAQTKLPDNIKIKYARTGINSISAALNYGWHYAVKNKYDCILTMDQDSNFEHFSEYYSFCEKMLENCDCIIGPWIMEDDFKVNESVSYIESKALITSGMIIPVSVLNNVGGYNEDFQIDAVDTEFCYRVRKNGYKVIMYKNASTRQKYGNCQINKMFGTKVITYNYPPSRLFEIIRNHILVYRKYKEEDARHRINRYIATFFPSVILYEEQKLSKIWAMVRGIVSGCCTPQK